MYLAPETLAWLKPGGGLFLPLAAALIALEYLHARLVRHDETSHDLMETAASLGVAFGDAVSRLLTGFIAAVPFVSVYEHRLFDVPMTTWWFWPATFLAVELAYYWFHRASHRVRWLWATHAVHHSATRFNLSAAIRLGWTGLISGTFVFFLPLVWLGIHPFAMAAVIALGLIYQFFLHTHLDVHLGPLELVLNTPRHHRVHHASNETCLDRNYGQVLIIWDRLFGTFAEAPRGEPLRFGLKGRAPSNNPFRIAFAEWGQLWRDVRQTRGLLARVKILFGAP